MNYCKLTSEEIKNKITFKINITKSVPKKLYIGEI